MLSVALNERTMYKDFDLEQEILFFKVGAEGLVSFHGSNYSRKVLLSASELKHLLNSSGYFRLSSSCYINVAKIKSIASGTISFGGDSTSSKMIPVSKRTQMKIEQLYSKVK